MASADSDVDAMWQVGVFDAHCHPTDIMASLRDIPQMHARTLTVMATRREDQELVEESAKEFLLESQESLSGTDKRTIVPAFGWHPWFSHQMYDDRESHRYPVDRTAHYKAVLTPTPEDRDFLDSLPEPILLSEFIRQTTERLEKFPVALVGEVGLDRSFRLPRAGFIPAGDMTAKTGGSEEEYTPGSREGRPLTPHRVSLDHQKVILKAQLELAGRYQRPVSVHSVQTHGAVFDVLQELWSGHERPSKRERRRRQSHPDAVVEEGQESQMDKPLPFPPRICMHSYSGPPDALTQFLAKTVPADIYFSFSICINFSTPAAKKAGAVIKAVPADRILVESDFHCAGEKMDELLRDIVVKVCEIKGWELLEGTRQLRRNWETFVFGT